MNTTFIAALSGTLTIFFFIMSGYILRAKNFIPENSSSVIASLLMNLLAPALQIHIIINYVTVEILRENYVLILTAVTIIAVTWMIAKPLSKLFSKNKTTASVFEFAILYSNFGFMAIPIIESIFSDAGFGVLILFTIPYYMTVNILGEFILRPNAKLTAKMIFTPINISIVVGLAIVIFSIPIAPFIKNLISSMYACVTPLSMLLAGVVIAKRSLKEMFVGKAVYLLSVVRLIIIPFSIYFILKLCGFDGLNLVVPVLALAMPVAVNGVMLAESSGGDSYSAAQCAFITTLISIVTIPVLAWIFI